jgi:glucose-1-phosphate thymidylyltransferase
VTLVNDGSTDDHVRLGSVRDMQLVIQQHQVHDPLLISAGDHIAEWDLDAFIRFGQSRAPHASVALYRLPDPALACKFGIAHIDAKQQIISFAEKPAHTTSDLAAVCVYYFPPEIFPRLGQYLGTGENADAPGYFVRWLSRQEPVYGWPAEGRLFDIGSIEAYTEAQREFEGAAT